MPLPDPMPYSTETEKLSNCDDGAEITVADIPSGPGDSGYIEARGPSGPLGCWHTFELVDAGDVKVTTLAGHVRTFTACPAGWSPPLKISRLWKTGTTATKVRVLA
jgi:hypothetical protein